MIIPGHPEGAHFLNVDLDLQSGENLQPILDALGGEVDVLHAGRVNRAYNAHLELSTYTRNADATIGGLCALIELLPAAAKAIWDKAKVRDFNVGVQAAAKPYCFEIKLAAKTVKAVSSVGGRIVFTVYAPKRPEREIGNLRPASKKAAKKS